MNVLRRSPSRKVAETVVRPGTRLRGELQRQRRAAHRFELTGRLALEIAGDLDKMASAVLASTIALAEELGDDERLLSKLSELRQAGERTSMLARQLLAIGESAPKVAVVELGQVLERMTVALRPLLGDDVELELVAERKPCRSRVDVTQLDALVFNLIAGCLEAMPDGGRLRVEASPLLVRAGEAASGEVPAGSYATLTIVRHSAGIDDTELPRTFEPGASFAARRGGALDEAMVAELVAECGGYLSSESEPVRGKFVLFLPSTDEPAARAARSTAPVLPGGFETVLLVDGSRATRLSGRRILRARGYRVIEAGNAEQALQASARYAGQIAAVLTDVVLSDMNGYLLAERLRRERPELKLLFMSSYQGHSDDGGIRLVGTGALRKPFTAEALSKALRSLLDGSV